MIASPDLLHGTRQEPSPGPAAVGEEAARPGPAANADNAAPCAIPGPSDPGVAEDGDDELVRLGERIAELAARINSAESRMMALIAEFDRRGGWKGEYSSCAEWLAWRIGIKIGPARERVRTARALAGLPQTAEALREGRTPTRRCGRSPAWRRLQAKPSCSSSRRPVRRRDWKGWCACGRSCRARAS